MTCALRSTSAQGNGTTYIRRTLPALVYHPIYIACKPDNTRSMSGLFTGHDPTRGLSQEVFKILWVGSRGCRNLTDPVVSGQEVFKSHGSDRVGLGRIRRCSNITGRVMSGRVGPGQDVVRTRGWNRVGSGGFQTSRAGSGQVRRLSKFRGRLGSGQDISFFSRAGSGQTRPDP